MLPKEESSQPNRSLSILQILKYKSQRTKILCLCYIWFSSGFCFYGLLMNLENLGGDFFIDGLVTFIAEIISEMLSGWAADEFGRLIVLRVSGLLGGLGFILYEIITYPQWLKTVLIFVTSFGFAAVANLTMIFSPETFPTSIRSTVMGVLFFLSRLGGFMVPSVCVMVSRTPFVFGALALSSTYLTTYLEETLGRRIEDEIPEVLEQSSVQTLLTEKKMDT